MSRVLQAALDLSTSTKPFDSVTAAHLLNLLLPHPELSQALLPFAQRQELQFTPASLPPKPSESAIVEVNTLAGKISCILLVGKCVFKWDDDIILCFSGAVFAAGTAVGGVEGRVLSAAGSCFLPPLWQSPLHHCSPAESEH